MNDVPEPANVHLLREGDMVATYADSQHVANVTLTRPVGRDDYTPFSYVTLWTTGGRFDVPDDSTLYIAKWAKLPEFSPRTEA